MHLVAYVGVNAMLVLLWAAGGDDRSIGDALAHPVDAVQNDGFWPIWPLGGWGSLLAVHGAIAVTVLRRRRRRRRQERAIGRHQAREAARARRQEAQVGLAPSMAAATTTTTTTPAAANPPPGRHWVVALFTDVVGSTGLAEALGDDEWNEVLVAHRRLVRQLVTEHGGTEVGTQGDGFLVRFADPSDAVACAAALQRRFETDRQAGTFVPPVRIGLHAGEVVGAEDGDLVGRMVNVAARVTAIGRAGEIVVTEPVADQLGPDVVLHDHGLHTLRGIERPRHLLTVDWQAGELPTMPTGAEAEADPDRQEA